MKKAIVALFVPLFLLALGGQPAQAQKWSYETQLSSNDQESARFGISIDVYGPTLLVGASGAGENGAAYFYQLDSKGEWGQVQEVTTLTRSESNGQLGHSVDVSDGIAVIGAPGLGTMNKDDVLTYGSGAAFIYGRGTNGKWEEQQHLRASKIRHYDQYGTSVAIGDGIIAVGARFGNVNAGGVEYDLAGVVYLYEKDANGTWQEVQRIQASDPERTNNFGSTVAFGKNCLAVGAPEAFTGVGSERHGTGKVYLFKKDGNGQWQETSIIAPHDVNNWSFFGGSLAFEGDVLVVGDPKGVTDENGKNNLKYSGALYVYHVDKFGSAVFKQKLTAAKRQENAEFGSSVAINGNRIVVGERNHDSGRGQGHIYELTSSGKWSSTDKFIPKNGLYRGYLGTDVALCGGYLFASSLATPTGGNVAVYTYSNANLYVSTCNGVLMASKPASAYQWFDCSTGANIDGANERVFLPESYGSYGVHYTEDKAQKTSGCEHYWPLKTTEQLESPQLAQVYPNPADEHLYVEPSVGMEHLRVALFNMSGKCIVDREFGHAKNSLDISHLPGGVYYLKLQSGSRQNVQKVVIK